MGVDGEWGVIVERAVRGDVVVCDEKRLVERLVIALGFRGTSEHFHCVGVFSEGVEFAGCEDSENGPYCSVMYPLC